MNVEKNCVIVGGGGDYVYKKGNFSITKSSCFFRRKITLIGQLQLERNSVHATETKPFSNFDNI